MRIAQPGQLGHPFADIRACIELLRLRQRRHDPHKHIRIDPRPCCPLPVYCIRRCIIIEQCLAKPRLAASPVDQQVLDQKRRRDHPHAVVHPSCRPQLAHPGVDDGVSGLSLGPGNKIRLGIAPRQTVKIRPRIRRSVIGKLVNRIRRIIAPANLAQIRLTFFAHTLGHMMPDSRGRNLAEMQMRRQA